MPPRVFVSYRHEDTAIDARRLRDALLDRLGPESVFMDTDIALGAEWEEVLRRAVADARTMVVVIGPSWLSARDEDYRRKIDLASDWVRREIELALVGGLLVVPMLVGGASMPRRQAFPPEIAALGGKQAIELREESWSHDLALLIDQLQRHIDELAGRATTVDAFRAAARGFDSRDVAVRQATAVEVADLASSLELGPILSLCRSNEASDRVGAAVALGVHLQSPTVRDDRAVLDALGRLLDDGRSRVRYRAAEAIRAWPSLVATFADRLGRLRDEDPYPQVSTMARSALEAASP